MSQRQITLYVSDDRLHLLAFNEDAHVLDSRLQAVYETYRPRTNGIWFVLDCHFSLLPTIVLMMKHVETDVLVSATPPEDKVFK